VNEKDEDQFPPLKDYSSELVSSPLTFLQELLGWLII